MQRPPVGPTSSRNDVVAACARASNSREWASGRRVRHLTPLNDRHDVLTGFDEIIGQAIDQFATAQKLEVLRQRVDALDADAVRGFRG